MNVRARFIVAKQLATKTVKPGIWRPNRNAGDFCAHAGDVSACIVRVCVCVWAHVGVCVWVRARARVMGVECVRPARARVDSYCR